MTIGNPIKGEAVGNNNRQQLSTTSVRSTRSTRLSRSPGIRILHMAGQTQSCQGKFSLNDFRLRNPDIFDDGSDEYDTDLESEKVRWTFYR